MLARKDFQRGAGISSALFTKNFSASLLQTSGDYWKKRVIRI